MNGMRVDVRREVVWRRSAVLGLWSVGVSWLGMRRQGLSL